MAIKSPARGESTAGRRWGLGRTALAPLKTYEKLGGFSTIDASRADRLPGSCRVRTRDPRWQLNHGHPGTPRFPLSLAPLLRN